MSGYLTDEQVRGPFEAPAEVPEPRPNLADMRDYNTDDGEPYWDVSAAHAIEATYHEMRSWPEARVLNPTTGEIFQGSLMFLVDRVVEAIGEGHAVRVEPVEEE